MRRAFDRLAGKEVGLTSEMKEIHPPPCFTPFVMQPNSLSLVLDGCMVKSRKREERKQRYCWKAESQLGGGEG